jgi:hypothetical protein
LLPVSNLEARYEHVSRRPGDPARPIPPGLRVGGNHDWERAFA